MKLIITGLMLSLLISCEKETSIVDNIALLTPSPGCTKAVSNELFFIHFKTDVSINTNETVTIYNEDGSVFEEVKLDGPAMVANSSTRLIFDPEKDMEVGKNYYVNFPAEAFSDGSAITNKIDWAFTCGQELVEVEKFCKGIDENFRLLIGLPANYDKNSDKTYPVVYITDGGFFNHNQYSEIADAAAKGEIQDLITVGITYPEKYKISDIRTFRSRDLGRYPDNLYHFLKDTIIPYIDAEYRTEKGNSTLIGNSNGGIFTAGVLTRYRENTEFPFQNLFAVAQIVDYVDAEAAMAEEINDLPLKFYLGIGGTQHQYRE